MNSATRTQGSGKKNGCGCSGAAGGCSCGGACGECHVKGLVRPVFFAGQLLTEDDLGALTDYVSAKNRLHNQALFGAGVVNGLQVSCHPCDRGRVIVQPGYAIDACGNDLILPAAYELDVKAMVRRLAIDRFGGLDCGDPCPPAEKKDPAPAATQVISGATQPLGRIDADTLKPASMPAARQRYAIYVRYCETETDPVAAYATDETCGEQSCKATRVREGVRFELRCCEAQAEDDIVARVGRCLGDLVSNERSVADSVILQQASSQIEEAIARIALNEGQGDRFSSNGLFVDPSVEPPDVASLGNPDVDAVVSLTSELAQLLAADRIPSQSDVLRAANAMRQLGALLALYKLTFNHPRPDPSGPIHAAVNQLDSAVKRFQDGATDGLLSRVDVELMQDVILATAKLAADYASFGQLFPDSNEPPPPPEPTFQEKLFARGGVLDRTLQARFADALDALKGTLVERVGASPLLTDCGLRRELQDLDPLGRAAGDEVTQSDAAAFIAKTRRLLAASLRFVLDCVCSAMSPPPIAGDDTAVLLACVSVERCEVVDVCSMQRTFVLSGAAMRYWLPPIGWLGEVLELLCCDGRSLLGDLQRGRSLKDLLDELTGGRQPGAAGIQILTDRFASYYGLKDLRAREIERFGQLLSVLVRSASTSRPLPPPAPPSPPQPAFDSRDVAGPPVAVTAVREAPAPPPIDINEIVEKIDIDELVDKIKRDPKALAALAEAVARVKKPRNS